AGRGQAWARSGREATGGPRGAEPPSTVAGPRGCSPLDRSREPVEEEEAREVEEYGRDERERVEAVEDPAMAGEEIAEVLDADVALEVRQREVADLAAHADDEPGREHAPPGKARERELPVEEREGDAERQSPERSFDRLVRREDGPAVAAEELASEEREDVVQLRREDDVDDEAEAVLPDREVREVGEEPR